MNSDSGSGFYFQNVMRNHQFFIQNEFLRENMSRPTNDISVFDSFTEEELFCANFNNIPSNNSSSGLSDNSNHNLYYQAQDNPNCNTNIEENKIYPSAKEFCETHNINWNKSCHITEVCKHKYGFKTFKGYHFEYVENYERVEDIEKIL